MTRRRASGPRRDLGKPRTHRPEPPTDEAATEETVRESPVVLPRMASLVAAHGRRNLELELRHCAPFRDKRVAVEDAYRPLSLTGDVERGVERHGPPEGYLDRSGEKTRREARGVAALSAVERSVQATRDSDLRHGPTISWTGEARNTRRGNPLHLHRE